MIRKPKVELNENNLLSGFMSEFGLSSLTSQPNDQIGKYHPEEKLSVLNILDLDFGNDSESSKEKPKKPLKIKQSDCTFESKTLLRQ